MTSASPVSDHSPADVCIQVDVWLEVGRNGRLFTYADGHNLGVDLGDLVLVSLRGRKMHGLVVARRNSLKSLPGKKLAEEQSPCPKSLNDVQAVVQRAAVEPLWREWLDVIAVKCHTSPFRMLKTALPPGWLGQRQLRASEPRGLWWVQLERLGAPGKALPRRQLELFNYLASRGGGTWQKDLQSNGFAYSLVKALVNEGLACREQRSSVEDSLAFTDSLQSDSDLENSQELTDEQQMAMKSFCLLPKGAALLLWGVTGSGKTEVYLQIAAKEVEEGRNCLILTPEIGLIPQLVDRFRRRFGSKVFEYHSGCPERERVETWIKALNSSNPLIIVGTRSAIFLPLKPLGLIVLDEEHDSSYKQESPMPCYHARDLALDRASRVGAKVVLGSATPSLSTWKSIEPSGPLKLVRLTRRISRQPLPPVSVVDMRDEFSSGHRRLISRPLMERLQALPQVGEQAVILVPRRGYSSFLSCRSCGEVVECPHCDVPLTVHRGRLGDYWLRCHWCDHREASQSVCFNCGSTAFKPFGAGTQRVVEHLAKELEGLRLLRFDRDTTRGKDGHRRLLKQFSEGQADVLVGTQMICKGMDLPRVTLAAVLAADGLLHRPDLHAAEQSLQLLLQLSGRAGRGERPGNVLIQTYCPDHPVILHLVDGRYEEFLEKEAFLRREAGLVPFSRACLLRLSGVSSAVTATAASVLAEQLKPLCRAKGWRLVGPAPAMVARVAGRFRWQLLLHGPVGSQLPLPAGTSLWSGLPQGVSLAVDPDPLCL